MTRGTIKRFGLAAGVCLLVGVSAALFLRPALPQYDGQPLTYWLTNLPSVTVPYSGHSQGSTSAPYWLPSLPSAAVPVRGTSTSYKSSVFDGRIGPAEPSEENSRKALAAIRAIGTNALPFLMNRLQRRNPPLAFDALVRRYSGNLPLIRRVLPTRYQVFVEHRQAVTGLLALCPLPPNTVVRLRKMSLSFQDPNWAIAGDILRAHDNPGLRDEALNSYFRDMATRKRVREAIRSGRFVGPPGQFGGPELHDTRTKTSIWAGVQLDLSLGPALRQTGGFTNYAIAPEPPEPQVGANSR